MWLIGVDREWDNFWGVFEWVVVNDDVEIALMIVGGVSWLYWLVGIVVEGKRWFDDAFCCGGEVFDRVWVLVFMGWGLIDF